MVAEAVPVRDQGQGKIVELTIPAALFAGGKNRIVLEGGERYAPVCYALLVTKWSKWDNFRYYRVLHGHAYASRTAAT